MPTVAPRGSNPAVILVLGSCISLQFGAAFAAQLFPALGSWGTTTLRLGIAALVLHSSPLLPRALTAVKWTCVREI